MKKLILVATLALSFISFGAFEKVAIVQLADTETLVKGVAKLGEFTGNQMLGIMASQSITKLPWIEVFGAARPGAATTFIVFMNGDDPEGAILYPATMTAAEFKQKYPKVTEKDGFLYLPKAGGEDENEDEEEDEDDESSSNFLLKDDLYVSFTADGKWLVASDKAELTKCALAEVKSAEKKLDGDLLKIIVPSQGVRKLEMGIEKKLAEKDGEEAEEAENMRNGLAIVKQLSMFGMGIRVNDLGLDFRGVIKPTKGSDFEKIGLKSITADAWKTVDPAAVCFSLEAADSGKQDVPLAKIRAIFEKYGIKTDFLAEKIVSKGFSTLTLDLPAAVAYVKGAEKELKEKFDCSAFFKDFQALVDLPEGQLFPLKNDPIGASLVLKDFTPIANAKERFDATLPEVKDKPCSNVGFLSAYSIFKAVTPIILENIDKDDRAMLEPLLLTLPPEGKSANAWALWSEKGAKRFIFRIGADEFKSVSAGFAAFSAMQMQKIQKAMQNEDATLQSVIKE